MFINDAGLHNSRHFRRNRTCAEIFYAARGLIISPDSLYWTQYLQPLSSQEKKDIVKKEEAIGHFRRLAVAVSDVCHLHGRLQLSTLLQAQVVLTRPIELFVAIVHSNGHYFVAQAALNSKGQNRPRVQIYDSIAKSEHAYANVARAMTVAATIVMVRSAPCRW